MNRLNKSLGLCLVLLIVSCSSSNKVSTLDPKVSKRLDTYQEKVDSYSDMQAGLISPRNFERTKELFSSAKERAYNRASLEEINTLFNNGDVIFSKIDENIKLSKVHLSDVISARNQAIKEGGEELEVFVNADKEFTDLGYELENKDLNEVLEKSEDVKKLYIEAEIEAIKMRVLARAKGVLRKVKEYDSLTNFEKEKNKADRDLESASVLITKFKDKPSRYKKSVKVAESSAKRLLALVTTASWVDANSTRDIVLKLDRDMNKVLSSLAYKNTSLMAYDEKMRMISQEAQSIPFLIEELTATQYDSYLQRKRLSKLKKKNELISDKLVQKRKAQAKIREIQSMFEQDEAKVLVQGDDVIIRLVGLNFDSNEAALPNGSKKLLRKVVTSAKTLNYPEMKIIGHADAKGDALYNEKLSKKRARTVTKYLVKNSEIKKDSTYILGAGFRKPIAENKTWAGRKNNRRIDIVFSSVVD